MCCPRVAPRMEARTSLQSNQVLQSKTNSAGVMQCSVSSPAYLVSYKDIEEMIGQWRISRSVDLRNDFIVVVSLHYIEVDVVN